MNARFAFLNEPNLQTILSGLNQTHETRVVGGAVRNALLDLPIADIDLATTATPEQVQAIAELRGWRALPTGIAHGTITLMLGTHQFEVTTLREDVATDGRHAEVRFGTDFEADAQRRDFTINALSLSPDATLHDYTGGAADIAQRRVRFIGDASQRIKEDYLRILRFFRFSSAYAAGALDHAALTAIIENRFGLNQLSKERISTEIFKTLLTLRAGHVFKVMSDCGILQLILDGIGNPARLARLITIEECQNHQNALARLAALAVFSTANIKRLREALRLSNADTEALQSAAEAAVTLHGLALPPDKGRLRELMFDYGKSATLLAVQVAHAQSAAPPESPQWLSATRFVSDTPQPTLPFTGADLLARGYGPGKQLGAALKRLQALWIRAGFPKDPQALAALLDEALKADPIPLRK